MCAARTGCRRRLPGRPPSNWPTCFCCAGLPPTAALVEAICPGPGAGRPPELPDLPTGALLGVGGVPFETTNCTLNPGDQLVLYSDGLVETCDDLIDERLDALLYLLSPPCPSAEETCDRLLQQLRQLAGHDEAALLIAHAQPLTAV
jgi:hypothetical protein